MLNFYLCLEKKFDLQNCSFDEFYCVIVHNTYIFLFADNILEILKCPSVKRCVYMYCTVGYAGVCMSTQNSWDPVDLIYKYRRTSSSNSSLQPALFRYFIFFL